MYSGWPVYGWPAGGVYSGVDEDEGSIMMRSVSPLCGVLSGGWFGCPPEGGGGVLSISSPFCVWLKVRCPQADGKAPRSDATQYITEVALDSQVFRREGTFYSGCGHSRRWRAGKRQP